MTSLIIMGLMEFVRGALVLSLLPIYGQYSSGFSLGVIGTAISLHYLSDNLFRIPAGWINDRLGGKWLLLFGTLLSGCGLVLMYFAYTSAHLWLGAILFGLGVSPLWPVVISVVSTSMPLDQIGEALSRVFIAWLVGSGAGPVSINFILGKSYSLSFWALMLLVMSSVLITLIMPFPKHDRSVNKPIKLFLLELLRESIEFKVLYPGMFVQTLSIGILIPVITVYCQTVFGISLEEFSYFLIGAGLFTVILLVPAGKLADRLGVKGPLVAGLAAAALFLALLPLQRHIANALMLGALIGISYAFILPAWNGLIARVISPEKRGVMWAWFMTVEGIGTATGSYIGAAVWDGIGPQAPFFFSASVLAIMALVYCFIDINALITRNHSVS
ncbi:MAG: MFS transporter [Syntrophomonadaceae bacterium]